MREQVVRYLVAHYGITELEAINLVSNEQVEIENAIRWNSSPYYPAERIAERANLIHSEGCPGCAAESAVKE